METIFGFRAITLTGASDEGTVDAESLSAAREILASRGLLVLTIDRRGTRRAHRERLSAADLALGLRVLADLLESGLPIGRALHAFGDLAPRAWNAGLPQLRQSVREGKSLATALADAPLEIPPLVVGIIQAGEAGTGLGAAVRRAAELTEATAEMHASIRSALAYPLVVAIAGACAITVLLTVVLPRFARILADLGQRLPASTQIVLHGAALAQKLVIPGLCLAAVSVAVWRAWSASTSGRVGWHRLLLAIPAVGTVRHRSATSRMSHALSAMLESGVPIATALTYAGRASGDAEIENRLSLAREKVVTGQSLSSALEGTDAVTLTTVRLIRAGEESGRLPSMLSHAAKLEQKGADQTVRTAVRMLEPILLLTFASVVALIAAALLQAIYSVRPA